MKQIWRLPHAARRELWNAVGYIPNKVQLLAHLDPHRLKQIAGGERGSKSFWVAHELGSWTLLCDETDILWLVGPDYELARPEFIYILDYYSKINLIDSNTVQTPSNGAWQMRTRNGCQIVTKTSADIKKLAGIAPSGVVMCEAAQQDFDSFIRCRGRVAQKRGPLILSGTFETSRGWYADMYRSWLVENKEGGKCFSFPTWSNTALFPGGRNDPEILALEATLPPDMFMERYGAVPCPPSNLVFREFDSQIHVRPCPFDSDIPVQVWVDPGYAGAYAVLAVQYHAGEWWVIDEVYLKGEVVHNVIDTCKEREWWPNVSHGVIDIAGRQHAGQESQVEVWLRYANVRLYSQYVEILPGIERLRTFLRDPATGKALIYFDPRCVNTIKEYGLYQYPKSKERHHMTELPIQQNNHSTSATIYGLVLNCGLVDRPPLGDVSVSFKRG